jgi:hypothetical protein
MNLLSMQKNTNIQLNASLSTLKNIAPIKAPNRIIITVPTACVNISSGF